MTDWIILRTASSSTLSVAEALADAGFDVWTPSEQQQKRQGPARDRKPVDVPLMPTFVFARHDALTELVKLSRSPASTYKVWDSEKGCMVTRGVPYFSVFRFLDGYPRISDRALDPLRQAEQRRRPKVEGQRFTSGAEVLYPDAGFEGLRGVVETARGRFAIVCFRDGTATITARIPQNSLVPIKDAA